MLGDGVTIYPGAKLLGGITMGDGALIGANSVVVKDVPAGAIVKTQPAGVEGADPLADAVA